MSWLKNILIGLVLIVLVAVGLQFAFYWNRPAAEVFRAERGKALAAVYGTVKIEWLSSINIRAQNSGFIELASDINKGQSAIGMRVEKGQVLARILDEATSNELRQARVELQAAQDRKRLGPPSVQALASARDSLERLQKLNELQNVAAADLERLRNEVDSLERKVETEIIEIDRTVQVLEQKLGNLQKKLGRTEIQSPIDGVLTAIHNVNGELVFENNTLFTVAYDQTYVLGQVNEEDVGSLQPGMRAKIRLYSYPQNEFVSTLTSILPTVDTSTNRYSVILNMEEPPSGIMAGMTGEMNIILGERENSILIPTRALLLDRILVVEDEIVKPREVEIGFRSLEKTEILSGLDEGEQVIVADQDLFSPGDSVRPLVINEGK